jgi:AcrR family transcriptional regulator
VPDRDTDGDHLDGPARRRRVSHRATASGTGTRRTSKRQSIIDGTERLMIAEGYGAVTFRSAATAAGVAPGLVQYYFPTLGELFVAVLRQATDRLVGELTDETVYEQPLRAVWAYASDPAGSALLMQFMALANQQLAVGAVIGEGGERVRQALLDVVSSRWAEYGLDAARHPPAAALFILSAVARMAHFEQALGTTTGHAEAFEIFDRFLDRVEPLAAGNDDSPTKSPATHQKGTRDAQD